MGLWDFKRTRREGGEGETGLLGKEILRHIWFMKNGGKGNSGETVSKKSNPNPDFLPDSLQSPISHLLTLISLPRRNFGSLPQTYTIQMSAIFDFSSLVTVLLLLICTATYLRALRPHLFDSLQNPGEPNRHTGFSGFLWKLSRIGERTSPYVSVCLVVMALHVVMK